MGKLFGPTHYTEHDLKEEGFRALGSNVRIARNCTVVGAENISIGNNVRIDGYSTIIATGDGYVTLGSNIHIGGHCTILAGKGFVMNDFSTLSWGVRVFTQTDDFSGTFMTNPTVPSQYTNVYGGLVTLGRHSVIGAGCVILPNINIPEGVAVGALSLLNQDLVKWSIYAGIPAKIIKKRSSELLSYEQDFIAEKSESDRA